MKPRYRVKAGSRPVMLADLGRARRDRSPQPALVEVAETTVGVVKRDNVQALICLAVFEDGGVWTGKFFGAGTPIWTVVGALEHLKLDAEKRIER